MKINRNILCILIITLILASVVFIFNKAKFTGSKVSEIKSGKNITFFITSDTHYIAESLTDNGDAFKEFVNSGDGKDLNHIHEIMSAFSNDIKNKKPDVLIISGDLTSNGEKEGHLELAKRLKEIEKMGTSVYVIPGNHDILNPYARGFKGSKQYKVDNITDKDFEKIYKDFGYDEAISRDKTTLSYLAAPSEDVWLLMLDTAQYKNNITLGQPQIDGEISSETLDWIKQCGELAKSKNAKLIAVMHHNLLNHSETINKGFTINNNEAVIKVFQQYGIDLTLSGHIHLQDIKSYKGDGSTIYDVASGCIGVFPHKYGILNYSPKEGIDYKTVNVDVEGWSKKEGIVDENLNNFKEFSKKDYGDRIYSKLVSRLAITDTYSTEELKLMGETYTTLYLRYYEGEREVGTEEIKNSPGFKLWLASQESSMKRNIMRLANTNGEENNKLHIADGKTAK